MKSSESTAQVFVVLLGKAGLNAQKRPYKQTFVKSSSQLYVVDKTPGAGLLKALENVK